MTNEKAKECAEKNIPVYFTDNDGEEHEASILFVVENGVMIEMDGKYRFVRAEEIEE